MTVHDDRVYVALIRDAARGAMETISDMTRDEFLASELGQRAVALDVVRVVECVPKLSVAYKAAHAAVDWDELGTLRARTEPEFAKIDAEAEWEAATALFPPIAAALDALLPVGEPWNGTATETAGPAEAGPAAARASMRPAASPLPVPHEELDALCQKLHVTSLRMFGSAVRDDFGPDSDIDLLVEYEPGTNHPWGGASLGEEFSPLFGGHEVELGDAEHLNPYVREGILAEAVEIYPVDHRPAEKVK
jgi:predicted nucleotidyltransferase/uncharacterized protein with HEPN domain